MKSKGVTNINLNKQGFINLYKYIDIKTKKSEYIKNYSKKYVFITDNDFIYLSANTNKKKEQKFLIQKLIFPIVFSQGFF